MSPRIAAFLKKLHLSSIDGFLVSKEANVAYLCSYNIRDSYLLVTPQEVYLITDFRYTEEARKNIKGVKVYQYKNLFKDIALLAQKLKIRRFGFEAKDLNFAEYTKIKEYLGPKNKLIDTFNIVETLRQIKAPEELEYIKEAIGITARAFVFLKNYLKPGISELEIAGEFERFIRYQGAQASAFSIIAASGPNSSFPHAGISERKLKADDLLLVDIGVEVKGYKSDLTRVFFLDTITPIQRRIHKIIQGAQAKAIEAIKPKIPLKEIDACARSYIATHGYGKYFGHSLGHGVGLEVHEEPSLSAKNTAVAEAGMVFTIEPGIYLPGKFGIRLEDMVLVTKKGFEVLSGAVNKSI